MFTILITAFFTPIEVGANAQVEDLTHFGNTFAVHDVELNHFEGRGYLVLHHFHLGAVTGDVVLVLLDLADAADVEANRRVEFQGVTTGGGFGRAEHDADFLAQLVDEDAAAAGFVDGAGELPQGLAHEAGVQADFRVAHVAFELAFRHEGGHGVDDDDVDGAAGNQLVGNFEGLLAVVGLGDEQVGHVDAELSRVDRVEGVLGVDEGRHATVLLRLGDAVHREGGLTGRFGAVDFNHAAARQAAHAEGDVEAQRTGANDFHVQHLAAG